jgi:cyclopropane-fatty-acyl-phospholipid synthase
VTRRRPDVASLLEPPLRRFDPARGANCDFALRFWDGSELPASTGRAPRYTIEVRDPAAVAHVLWAPSELGVARAWVTGALDLEGDFDAALRALRRRAKGARRDPRALGQLAVAAARAGAWRRPALPAGESHPRGRRHSLRRDRAAVRHHYETPTAFYRLVLGPSLVYSCACFENPDESLESAQERKLDLICRKLELREGEHLLDVGCGWGSLILHAAARYGVRALGVTLSPSQAHEARRRIAQAGLEGRCEVRVCDYREVRDGPFDKVASVGMYEHVGHDQLGAYAGRLLDLLAPGGALLNHGIARLRPRPPRVGGFIGRYVFPDGELHPVGDFLAELERRRFELRHIETLREHYALTLRRWVANLEAHRDEAIRLAGTERERIWRLYMTASAHAFDHGELGVYQTLAVRPAPAGAAPRRLDRTVSAAASPERTHEVAAPGVAAPVAGLDALPR